MSCPISAHPSSLITIKTWIMETCISSQHLGLDHDMERRHLNMRHSDRCIDCLYVETVEWMRPH